MEWFLLSPFLSHDAEDAMTLLVIATIGLAMFGVHRQLGQRNMEPVTYKRPRSHRFRRFMMF